MHYTCTQTMHPPPTPRRPVPCTEWFFEELSAYSGHWSRQGNCSQYRGYLKTRVEEIAVRGHSPFACWCTAMRCILAGAHGIFARGCSGLLPCLRHPSSNMAALSVAACSTLCASHTLAAVRVNDPARLSGAPPRRTC